MPPKRRVQVVRWLVSPSTGLMPPMWLDRPLTEYEKKRATVLAYGMDDGTVRWRLED